MVHTAPMIMSQSLQPIQNDTLHLTRTLHVVNKILRKIMMADTAISSSFLVGKCSESAILRVRWSQASPGKIGSPEL
jgi:hypothetical protein